MEKPFSTPFKGLFLISEKVSLSTFVIPVWQPRQAVEAQRAFQVRGAQRHRSNHWCFLFPYIDE
jgi:hypothetical protein